MVCNHLIPFSRSHGVCCWSQSQLQAKGGYTLDKLPGHRRALRSNFGIQQLAKGHAAPRSRDLNQIQWVAQREQQEEFFLHLSWKERHFFFVTLFRFG